MSRKEATFQLRCTDEELQVWRSLAASKGLPLAAYVRALLTAMVEKERSNGNL